MMTAFDCYKDYVALKSHFTKPGYDYFKYNGKMKLNYNSFEKRKDKIFFEKLAKHSDPHGVIVSNLVQNSKAWIRDIAYGEHANKIYVDWLKKQQSLMYMFKEELGQLFPDFDRNFMVEGNHPHLMKLYFAGKVSIETMVILVDLSGCFKYWNSKLEYDPIAEDVLIKLSKYKPFVEFDRDKAKKIVLDKFSAD